ncbi:MAG: hypothetical protein ACK2TV_04825, partial [Anaerolineales bacterium]
EDYDFMSAFIDRVEKRVEKKRREEDLEEQRRYEAALATVPELTFEINILDVDLKEHILYILQEAGIETLGDLVLQMRLDPDRILGLNGIGPKTFEEISELTDALRVSPEEEIVSEEVSQVVEELEVEPVTEVEEEVGVEEESVEASEPEVIAVEMSAEEVAEEEQQVSEAAEVVETEQKAKSEEKEFDKLFSYDARKYGYYEPEPAKLEEEEEEPHRPSKKKKRKKRRPYSEETEEWEDW